MELKSEILREVGVLARTVQSLSDIKFKEYNLQRGQFIFMTRIAENPGMSLIELTNLLKVDKATTTKAIQKLVHEGYVQKERREKDKRSWQLYPTRKGEEIYEVIIQVENQHVEMCLKGLDSSEIALINQLIRNMRVNIEKRWRVYKGL